MVPQKGVLVARKRRVKKRDTDGHRLQKHNNAAALRREPPPNRRAETVIFVQESGPRRLGPKGFAERFGTIGA